MADFASSQEAGAVVYMIDHMPGGVGFELP